LAIAAGSFIIILDQALKFCLAAIIPPHESVPIIQGIFHITVVYNTGAAFGLFKGQPSLFFIGVSAVAIMYLIYFLKAAGEAGFSFLLGIVLMLAGSASNLVDRFRTGCVIDYLDFRIWPVFNLGDTAISIGVFILVLHLVLKPRTQQTP
jgi:signal peptidase II